jgi:hypothetical protein
MPDKGFHWTHKGGYISKLAVQSDGTLKMVNEKLITGLTGPLGMAVIPVSTKKFPKGTIFLIEAWAPLAEADGTEVKDPSVLDPDLRSPRTERSSTDGEGPAGRSGSRRGRDLGNELASTAGNPYAIDTGIAGLFNPPIATRGAVPTCSRCPA